MQRCVARVMLNAPSDSITPTSIKQRTQQGRRLTQQHLHRAHVRIHFGASVLIDKTKGGLMTNIYGAESYAILVHADQRYGDLPYEVHLRSVVATLIKFGWDSPPLLAAGWLHDVIEDTSTTAEDLAARFGLRVADLVSLVSDPPNLSRAERKAEVCKRLAEAQDVEAIALKLADRIANMEQSLLYSSCHFKMYAKEYPYFRSVLQPCSEHPLLKPMWEHLDRLLIAGRSIINPAAISRLTEATVLLLRAKQDAELVSYIDRPDRLLNKDWRVETDALQMEPDEWLGICWNRTALATKEVTGQAYLGAVDEVDELQTA